MTMVASQNVQYRQQRGSPPTTTILLKPTLSSIGSTTATMRFSPQKGCPGQQPQCETDIGTGGAGGWCGGGKSSSFSYATKNPISPMQHRDNRDPATGGRSGKAPSLGGLPDLPLIHQSTSDNSLSSTHAATPNTAVSRHSLPTTLPTYSTPPSGEDVSKKRRRRGLSYYTSRWADASLQQRAVFVVIAIFSVWYFIRTTKRIYRKLRGEQLPPPQRLDFLIAGFPKSGTTTLLAALRDHPEIAMDSTENCQLARPIQQDDVNLKRLNRYLFALKNDVVKERTMEPVSFLQSVGSRLGLHLQPDEHALTPDKLQAGIKCPDAVKNFKAIHRLSQHSPNCRFVVGVRHPILFLQSFYNYRVIEAHAKNRPDIPSLFDIWERRMNWWDISPDATRFEMFLSQFGKTELSLSQMQDWFVGRPMLAVKPNQFKIFLYSQEQMEEDWRRGGELRHELQKFLGLKEEIEPFGHENRLLSLPRGFRETIDICSPEYASLRQDILHNAVPTVEYMHQFLESPDVVVSNKPLLVKQIETWTRDPCEDAMVMDA